MMLPNALFDVVDLFVAAINGVWRWWSVGDVGDLTWVVCFVVGICMVVALCFMLMPVTSFRPDILLSKTRLKGSGEVKEEKETHANVDGNGTIHYLEFITPTMRRRNLKKDKHLYN
ncbi:hypothetical protein Tco_1066794 [Tanacetum coccineum]|uniref:Transmembrane protein n=1 Tax=Tanacetum coccineum TaxID=301880 RepID=A0ABQ5HCR8_9ASTR